MIMRRRNGIWKFSRCLFEEGLPVSERGIVNSFKFKRSAGMGMECRREENEERGKKTKLVTDVEKNEATEREEHETHIAQINLKCSSNFNRTLD